MRLAVGFFALGLVSLGCGESAPGGDLFAPTGAQGTRGPTTTTGSPTGSSSATDGAGGSAPTGSGGASAGTGTGTAGGGGDTGGATGAGGDPAGGGGSGGTGGAANAGASGSSMGGASGSAGAGTGGSAGASDVDAGVLHPIRCGNSTCAGQKEFCCIQESQGSSLERCVAVGSFCSDGADRVYCDDRTDCAGVGEVCCAADNLSGGASTAACVVAVQCANPQRKTQQLCDVQHPSQCIGMLNPCRVDSNATIPGYPYCH